METSETERKSEACGPEERVRQLPAHCAKGRAVPGSTHEKKVSEVSCHHWHLCQTTSHQRSFWSEKKVFRRLLLEIHHHPAFWFTCSFMCIDFVISMHCKVSEFSEKRYINKNVSFITMNHFRFMSASLFKTCIHGRNTENKFCFCSVLPSGLLWARIVTTSPLGISKRKSTASSLTTPWKSTLLTLGQNQSVRQLVTQLITHVRCSPPFTLQIRCSWIEYLEDLVSNSQTLLLSRTAILNTGDEDAHVVPSC